jgi:hypothetical protein
MFNVYRVSCTLSCDVLMKGTLRLWCLQHRLVVYLLLVGSHFLMTLFMIQQHAGLSVLVIRQSLYHQIQHSSKDLTSSFTEGKHSWWHDISLMIVWEDHIMEEITRSQEPLCLVLGMWLCGGRTDMTSSLSASYWMIKFVLSKPVKGPAHLGNDTRLCHHVTDWWMWSCRVYIHNSKQ